MSTGRNNTPAWMNQAVATLATIASTLGAIYIKVPEIVQEQTRMELAAHSKAMVHHMDSVFVAMADTMQERFNARAAASVDTVLSSMGLVVAARAPGQAPRITILPDTAGDARLADQLERIELQQDALARSQALITVQLSKWDRSPNRRGKD